MGNLSLLPHLFFNYLFILAWAPGYLFDTLGYNLVIYYVQILPVSVGSCGSLTPPAH
jgi:hypothetical protein